MSSRPLISVIIAAYNVENYIEATTKSIERQSAELSDIEFIVVDDASTDLTNKMIRRWVTKSALNIKLISNETNLGVAAARAEALRHVSGRWVTSIDPDDIIDKDYFREIKNFLRTQEDKKFCIVVSNIIAVNDSTGRINDNHTLKYRFTEGNRVVDVTAHPEFIQLGATAFLDVDVIRNNDLDYDSRVRPTFEDAHFIGRYLSVFDSPRMGLVASAKYYYRKRSDSTSLVQSSWASIEKYRDVVEYGYLGLLKSVEAHRGYVPTWAQNMVLYDVFWYFLEDSRQFSRTAWLSAEQQKTFLSSLADVFDLIDVDTVLSFNIFSIEFSIKMSLIAFFKNRNMKPLFYRENCGQLTHVYGETGRDFSSSLEFLRGSRTYSYFGAQMLQEKFYSQGMGNLNFSPGDPSIFINIEDFASETLVTPISNSLREKLAKIVLLTSSELLHAKKTISLMTLVSGQPPIKVVEGQLRSIFRKIYLIFSNFFARRHRIDIIKRAQTVEVQSNYTNCWIVMDRPDKADDNGEHLYRHIRKFNPEINAFFVLKKSSRDWDRLSGEGFRLLDYGSDELACAILNASYRISSDAVAECMYPVHRSLVDRGTSRFVFLQHGVLMNDLSRWLNPKDINLIISSTFSETENLAGNDSPYRFLNSQVALTGLARFDDLLLNSAKIDSKMKNIIMFMPTWRHELVQNLEKCTSDAQRKRLLNNSDYINQFRLLTENPDFQRTVERYHLVPVFLLHPSMQKYKNLLKLPSNLLISDASESGLQKILIRTRVLVTDYSSISFDAAYIGCPSIYFQFDRDVVFSGGHNFRKGYFDYQRDGLGPVSETVAGVVRLLALELSNRYISSEFSERIRHTFAYMDSQNCARIVQSIIDSD